jgi:hypothetical protein
MKIRTGFNIIPLQNVYGLADVIRNKGQMIRSVKNDYDVTRVAADNFKFVVINKNMLFLTFTLFEN